MIENLFPIIEIPYAIDGVLGVLLSTIPLQYDLQFYIDSMFSSYHEVHSFQMGIYAGIVVLVLTARGYTRLATLAIIAAFAFALGLPPSNLLCDQAAAGCGGAQVQTKPWYFMTGVLVLGLLGPRLLEFAADLAKRLTQRLPVETLHENPSKTLSSQAGPYYYVRAIVRRAIGSLVRLVRGAAPIDERARTDGGWPVLGGDGDDGHARSMSEFDPPTNRRRDE